jgi:hypothetical protein
VLSAGVLLSGRQPYGRLPRNPRRTASRHRRNLLDIDTATATGPAHRALIAMMVYSFARVGSAYGLRVEDVYTKRRRLRVSLREQTSKDHATPCHHNLQKRRI